MGIQNVFSSFLTIALSSVEVNGVRLLGRLPRVSASDNKTVLVINGIATHVNPILDEVQELRDAGYEVVEWGLIENKNKMDRAVETQGVKVQHFDELLRTETNEKGEKLTWVYGDFVERKGRDRQAGSISYSMVKDQLAVAFKEVNPSVVVHDAYYAPWAADLANQFKVPHFVSIPWLPDHVSDAIVDKGEANKLVYRGPGSKEWAIRSPYYKGTLLYTYPVFAEEDHSESVTNSQLSVKYLGTPAIKDPEPLNEKNGSDFEKLALLKKFQEAAARKDAAIFVTLGTAYKKSKDFFIWVADAIEKAKWNVAVAVHPGIDENGNAIDGDALQEELNQHPATRYGYAEFVVAGKANNGYWPLPHAYKFMDLVLSHGGANTVFEGLTYGIPTITLPGGNKDQFKVSMALRKENVGATPNQVTLANGWLSHELVDPESGKRFLQDKVTTFLGREFSNYKTKIGQLSVSAELCFGEVEPRQFRPRHTESDTNSAFEARNAIRHKLRLCAQGKGCPELYERRQDQCRSAYNVVKPMVLMARKLQSTGTKMLDVIEDAQANPDSGSDSDSQGLTHSQGSFSSSDSH